MASTAAPSAATASGNLLVEEKSPYLLQHKDNPVHWQPWGEAAFEEARRRNVPIFLSVGYSTCHWCHVMAHESFEDETIAARLNENFVAVKVDREERPDVDRLYMLYLVSSSGSGGWPMSVFLTPGLEPFMSFTYLPPRTTPGRGTGFYELLDRIAGLWKDDRPRCLALGQRVITSLKGYAAQKDAKPDTATVTAKQMAKSLQQAATGLASRYDQDLGGFGPAPKFPRPTELQALLRWVEFCPDEEALPPEMALEMVASTLEQMSAGGMYDHLGGGFHRYSVDEYWHVPHFEKMLYDNGQLVVSLLETFQLTQSDALADKARETMTYVLRDLCHADGGLFSAEDADSVPDAVVGAVMAQAKPKSQHQESGKEAHGHEGAFYVWSQAELRETLPAEDARVFERAFAVRENGNCDRSARSDPHGEFNGLNVLYRAESTPDTARALGISEAEVEQAIARSCATLLAHRAKRPRPHLDDKVLAAWSGMMLAGFARAHMVLGSSPLNELEALNPGLASCVVPNPCLGDSPWLRAGIRTAAFLRDNMWDADRGVLLRAWREGPSTIDGFAIDYAAVIGGLVELYQAGGDSQWLEWAIELQTHMDRQFWDAKWDNGYFESQSGDASLLVRMKEQSDGAEPCSNSLAVGNLLRLGALLGKPEYSERATKILAAFSDDLGSHALPGMVAAAQGVRTGFHRVAVALPPVAGSASGDISAQPENEIEALVARRMSELDSTLLVLFKDSARAAKTTGAESLGSSASVGAAAAGSTGRAHGGEPTLDLSSVASAEALGIELKPSNMVCTPEGCFIREPAAAVEDPTKP